MFLRIIFKDQWVEAAGEESRCVLKKDLERMGSQAVGIRLLGLFKHLWSGSLAGVL